MLREAIAVPSTQRRLLSPGSKVRVLIVDDSVVMRRLISLSLEDDPGVEVLGVAASGDLALKMIQVLKPDVVTLDIEMPGLSGLDTLREIRLLYPSLIVIMCSTLSHRGAAATMEALALGANDYVAKSAQAGQSEDPLKRMREELLPKVKQFFLSKSPPSRPKASAPLPPGIGVGTRRQQACRVVAIGVSTGGPNALAEVVAALPATFRTPILIVQHMPPVFTGLLAERLQRLTAMTVREGAEGMKIDPGCIYIAPGNFHMRVTRKGTSDIVALDQEPAENSCRPAVDVLFRSVAKLYGGSTIGVILTGMGQDGRRGAEALRATGAFIIAQDEASSVVWGMPGAVVQAGLADSVVSLASVAPELVRRIDLAKARP